MTTVTIGQGKVRGKVTPGGFAFLGIPYAAPPYGELRFQAPAAPSTWHGVREATDYGPTVLKNGYPAPFDALLPDPQIIGEDCLNVNVWTPDPASSGMPVLVWVHGGAFSYGSGAVPDYAGGAFARDGVVCVTINYRLGVDGFAWMEGAPANRGLLDQVAALEWVRENIAAFGGDPDKVTVAGESAGAMSVATLLAMPRARGLFCRAIAQSGAGNHAITTPTAKRIATYLAARLGVAASASDLATVPLDRLLAAQAEVVAGPQSNPDPELWGEVVGNVMAFEPVIDGDVLPVLPLHAIAAGAGNDVDVMVGTNADEQRLFVVPTGFLDVIDDNLLAMAALGWGLGSPGLDVYRANRPAESPGELLCAVGTDWFFRIPAIRLAEARVPQGARTFVYRFDWRSPLLNGTLGACHALEIPFVFDTLHAEGAGPLKADAPQALADDVHSRWVSFVSHGDPGWAPYDLDRRPTMVFRLDTAVIDDPAADERVVWDSIR